MQRQTVDDNEELEERSQGEQHDEEMEPSVDVLSQHGVSEETSAMIKHK